MKSEPEDGDDVTSQPPVRKKPTVSPEFYLIYYLLGSVLVLCGADVYTHASRGANMAYLDLTVVWPQQISLCPLVKICHCTHESFDVGGSIKRYMLHCVCLLIT